MFLSFGCAALLSPPRDKRGGGVAGEARRLSVACLTGVMCLSVQPLKLCDGLVIRSIVLSVIKQLDCLCPSRKIRVFANGLNAEK